MSLELLKKLREEVGVGMSDCKKALDESGGDYQKAVEWLRKKGISTAAKKAGRVAAEGLVGVTISDTSGAIIEINSETDFVARNESFQKACINVLPLALKTKGDAGVLQNEKIGAESVSEVLIALTASIGEKISFRRCAFLSVNSGIIASYVHNAVEGNLNLGKIAVILALESSGDKEKLKQFGKQLCMHIVASSPKCVTVETLSAADIEKEREIFKAKTIESGKPANIVDKIVDGMMSKYYSEVVLLEQGFVMDPKLKVKEVLASVSKEIGQEITIKDFVLYKLGEGIEKQETDFAAEVASMVS